MCSGLVRSAIGVGSSCWLPKVRRRLCSVAKVAFQLRDAKNFQIGVAENAGLGIYVVMSQYFPMLRTIVLPSSSGSSSPTKKMNSSQ